jgi:hypothetical protein
MNNQQSMRDLINLLESVGLANRRPGERFANPAGDEWLFQGLEFYPASGRVSTPNEMNALLKSLRKQGIDPEEIIWVNQATAAAGGFGIAQFQTDQGDTVNVGRWFGRINPNRQQNSWGNSELPGGFRLQSRAAQKETSDLQPSKILTQFQSNTPDTVAQQVSQRFGADSDEYRAIIAFMSQDLPARVPAGNMNKSAFQDYFCELLGPIALVQGKKVGGNAVEAADIFFGAGSGYGGCVISFNSNTIGSLYDSLLINEEGRQIKLSSKGREGATASVTNLTRSLAELQVTAQGKKITKKYQDAVDVIQVIQREGQNRAPLVLAAQFGIIDQSDIERVLALRDIDPDTDIESSRLLSKKLKKLYGQREARRIGRKVPYYHMLASIAFNVAQYVNDNTNFSEAASSILNHAALVQLYTTVTQDGGDFVINMTARYPAEAITGVILDPAKVYFSSGNKGNFTFKILKNGAQESDVNPADPVDTDEPDQEDTRAELDAVATKPRLTGPGAGAARSQAKPKMSADVLGRERRR